MSDNPRFTTAPDAPASLLGWLVIDGNYVDMDCDGVVCNELTPDQAEQVAAMLNAFPAFVDNRLRGWGWEMEHVESLQDDLRRLVQNDVTCVYYQYVAHARRSLLDHYGRAALERADLMADNMVDQHGQG